MAIKYTGEAGFPSAQQSGQGMIEGPWLPNDGPLQKGQLSQL